jgi:hypothetical protein
MKATKRALWALMLTLAFIVFTTNASLAAITAMCKVSPDQISFDRAYDNTPENYIQVSTGPNEIYMSWKISNEGEFFVLNSVTIDITRADDTPLFHEKYTDYNLGGVWNLVGVYGSNSYAIGPMNQGSILYGLAVLGSNSQYGVFLEPGKDVKFMATFDVLGEVPITTYATVSTNAIPEPASNVTFFSLVCLIFLLRRERK